MDDLPHSPDVGAAAAVEDRDHSLVDVELGKPRLACGPWKQRWQNQSYLSVGRDGGASQHRQDMPLVSLPGATRDDVAQVARLGAGVAATPGPPQVRRARPRPASVRAVAAPRAGPAQKPTYYWALPYSNGALSLSEGSVVMTVRLSRDQLRLAGIPVNAMQPVTDQPWVRAKVLVGADGLPRAIALDQD